MYLISLDAGDGHVDHPVLSSVSAYALVVIEPHPIRLPPDSIVGDMCHWITVPVYVVTMMAPFR